MKSWKLCFLTWSPKMQLTIFTLVSLFESPLARRVCTIAQSVSISKITLAWRINMICRCWSWILAQVSKNNFIIHFQCELFFFSTKIVDYKSCYWVSLKILPWLNYTKSYTWVMSKLYYVQVFCLHYTTKCTQRSWGIGTFRRAQHIQDFFWLAHQ